MYTNGIRKIYTAWGGDLKQSQEQARKAGFKALSFNGVIFIQDKDRDKDERVISPWIETCFRIEDFSDNADE